MPPRLRLICMPITAPPLLRMTPRKLRSRSIVTRTCTHPSFRTFRTMSAEQAAEKMAQVQVQPSAARPGKKKDKSGGGAGGVKVPKGTRDWVGADIQVRDQIFKAASDVFTRHGGVALDTPVFELKHILAGKYGEDSRLIYDLADQGGEECALRYDLTVPFARYIAMNAVESIKRHQIAKVYRRDQPAIARGRMREFWQCDFDIAGEFDPMIPDAEIICVQAEIFTALGLDNDVIIKVNHRKILDGVFQVAGVSEDNIRSISSAVDKLDKTSREEVQKEMEGKGLAPEVAAQVLDYTNKCGSLGEMLDLLAVDEKLMANEKLKQGLEDMRLLLKYLDAFEVTNKVSFDLSLARGLDYYTGLIFESIVELPNLHSHKKDEPRVGSVAAGGRYDNLVGMYSKRHIPCVGVSFGLDRIFTILKSRNERTKLAARNVDVHIMAFGKENGLLVERMALGRMLWNAGIKAEYTAKVKPKLPAQFKAAEAAGVPLAVILGEDELAQGKVRLKIMGIKDANHPDKDGVLVDRDQIVAEIQKRLSSL